MINTPAENTALIIEVFSKKEPVKIGQEEFVFISMREHEMLLSVYKKMQSHFQTLEQERQVSLTELGKLHLIEKERDALAQENKMLQSLRATHTIGKQVDRMPDGSSLKKHNKDLWEIVLENGQSEAQGRTPEELFKNLFEKSFEQVYGGK